MKTKRLLSVLFFSCLLPAVALADWLDPVSKVNYRWRSAATEAWVDRSPDATGHITILSSVNGIPVTYIHQSAFSGCTKLESVVIPSSVTEIGDWAFDGCTGLEKVDFSEGLVNILNCAFRNCTNLMSIDIPSSVVKLGRGDNYNKGGTFEGCTGIATATLSEGLIAIYDNTFKGCTGLKSIVIPSTVVTFGEYIFQDCTGLREVTVKEGVSRLGSHIFYNCTALRTLNLPSTLSVITEGAFKGCYRLKTLVMPKEVTRIEEEAFYGCTGLTSVDMLSSSVTRIHEKAFYNCKKLTSIVIAKGVTYIGSQAFESCEALESVSLPSTLNKIDYSAFRSCKALTTIKSYSIDPFSVSGVFESSIYSKATVYVPIDMKEDYEDTPGWENFTNIVESDEIEPDLEDLEYKRIYDHKKFDVNGDGVVDVADIASIITEMAASARELKSED